MENSLIGTLINALLAVGITYWIIDGEELTMTAPLSFVLFLVLLNSFEIGRLLRKVNQLKKER